MSNERRRQQDSIVFHSLTVEHFRGFNVRQEIPLDASAVVVSGANGRGKTSLFDAIQWLMLGRIQRLEELRFRRNEEIIVNSYAPPGSEACVEAKLKDTASGNWIYVTRTGDYRGSLLEVRVDGQAIVGNEAQTWLKNQLAGSQLEEDTFERELLSSALLQQDLVRSFLSTSSPAERYKILTRLLGLSALDEFVDQLGESEKHLADILRHAREDLDKAQEAVQKADQDIRESKARIETAPILTAAVKSLEEKAHERALRFLVEREHPGEADSGARILSSIAQYRELLRRLEELINSLYSQIDNKPESSLEELQEHCSSTEKSLHAERSRLEADESKEQVLLDRLSDARERADNLRLLASAAIPLLGEHCPVCSQAIDSDAVRAKLQELLVDQPELLESEQAYRKLQRTVVKRRDRIEKLEHEHKQALQAAESAHRWQARTELLINELREVVANLDACEPPKPIPQHPSIAEFLPTLKSWADDCQVRMKEVEHVARNLEAAETAMAESRRLVRFEKEMKHLQKEYAEKENTLKQAEFKLTDRRRFVQIARQKATEVVGEAFAELEPVYQDLFSRLAPHPTFTRLSFSHEVKHRQGSSIPKAIDEQENLEVSPPTAFSSAQANVAALCYFLALAFASSEVDFGFVLLDDPLQSMDDVNVLGLSDLCRFLRKEKQLIIATHEDRLSNLLIRKLTSRAEPMRTLRLNLTSWNRNGPYIDVSRIEPSPAESVLSTLA